MRREVSHKDRASRRKAAKDVVHLANLADYLDRPRENALSENRQLSGAA
jgi:hypothetical protein